MDAELDRRLREIEDLAGTAAAEAGSGLDLLEVRNELEAVEDRLAGQVREARESLEYRLEENAIALRRLQERLDEIAGTVDSIYGEMPRE